MPQLGDQQLQIGIAHQHRLQGLEDDVPGLIGLARGEEGLRGGLDLVERGHGALRHARRTHPRDLRRAGRLGGAGARRSRTNNWALIASNSATSRL